MISTYLANKILDDVFGATNYSAPGTVYIALFSVMPDNDGIGGTEISGAAYARVASTNNTTNWANASSRQKTNATDLTFAAAGDAWGSVVGAGIYDALTSGNLLIFGEFADPLNVLTNGIVSFVPGQFAATVL